MNGNLVMVHSHFDPIPVSMLLRKIGFKDYFAEKFQLSDKLM